MRIIAGEKRGTKLLSLPGDETRPTLARVREAMFGSIQFEITGSTVLDLFAGSGAFGLEALSRGAKFAVFSDAAGGAVDIIKKNIIKTGYAEKSKVFLGDYKKNIKSFQNQYKFDIVLLDPPYEKGYYSDAAELLSGSGILNKNALVIAESSGKPGIDTGVLKPLRQKKYGKVYLHYYRYEGAI